MMPAAARYVVPRIGAPAPSTPPVPAIFNNVGNWAGCTAWSNNGNLGSIALPAGGTAFAQFELWGGGHLQQVNVTY